VKKTLSLFVGLSFLFGVANAAELTVYHSPSCPHCHHARDFISETLVKEYPDLVVVEINASDPANRKVFVDAIEKCKMNSYGVPVVVIGEKCFQGYGPSSGNDYRAALNESAAQDQAKPATAENVEQTAESAVVPPQKPQNSYIFVYALIGILAIAIGFVALTKKRKKK